jgi:radial spoke head protein 4/6
VGEEWIHLPPVTPAQIQQARNIKRYFTGNLNTNISMPFEGNEINYLRAQIARISASTIISPRGFYEFGGTTGEEEGSDLTKNDEFSGYSAFDLLDLTNWVHHEQYVLPQGRTKWWNPNAKKENEEEEESLEDNSNKKLAINGMSVAPAKPEYGPEFLNPISNDDSIDEKTLSWSGYLTSSHMLKYSICIMKSNRWPGAFTYGIDK